MRVVVAKVDDCPLTCPDCTLSSPDCPMLRWAYFPEAERTRIDFDGLLDLEQVNRDTLEAINRAVREGLAKQFRRVKEAR